jgi:hypothetical protein
MEAQLDAGRRMARRRMAWWSFMFLLGASSAILGALLFGQSAVVAAALSAAATVVVGIFTVFTSIVLGYLGVSVAENIFKK